MVNSLFAGDALRRKPASKKPAARPDYNEIARNTKDADVPTMGGYTKSGMKGMKRRRRKGGKAKKETGPSPGPGDVAVDALPKAKATAKATAKRKNAPHVGDEAASDRRRLYTKTTVTTAGLRAKDLTASVITASTSPADFVNTTERLAAGNKVYSSAYHMMERKLRGSGHPSSISVLREKVTEAGRAAKAKWLGRKRCKR